MKKSRKSPKPTAHEHRPVRRTEAGRSVPTSGPSSPRQRDARPLSGLRRFSDELDPLVVQDVQQWRDHPELGKLLISLESTSERQRFFSFYAEAVIARHLLERNCDLRVEVLTPSGKSCDFEITSGGELFYLHVKHMSTPRPSDQTITVSSRLRYLERITRPYVVTVRWRPDADDRQMQMLVTQAAEFIRAARVGDELVVHDEDDSEIGGVRIVAPAPGDRVQLAVSLPDSPDGQHTAGFGNESPRIQRLLRKAYQQFMPKQTNVILIASSHRDDVVDFETALLGTHVERWDELPSRGRRVAHGRDTDGFWAGEHFAESRAGGWFQIARDQDSLPGRLWLRTNNGAGSALSPSMQETLLSLFTWR